MENNKIIDSEFRKKLFKDLIDAGFGKEESQLLLYRKLYDTLKDMSLDLIQGMYDAVNNDEIPLSFDITELNGYLSDMVKAQEVLERKKSES